MDPAQDPAIHSQPEAGSPADGANPESASAITGPPRPAGKPWQFKLLSISFALFCLEVGAFLVVFPQQDSWNLNYFSGLSPWVQDIWDASYFRWAVSGVGVINLYIAYIQIRNLFRP